MTGPTPGSRSRLHIQAVEPKQDGGIATALDPRREYERFLRERHRPNHARRTAAAAAGFFLPLLKPGDRVLDLGCGPGSITVGFGETVGPDGGAIGVDLVPGPAAVPLASADVYALPFADGTFDAIFANALLQHLADPLAALTEARRVCRAGGVIGVADLDFGGSLLVPPNPVLDRGQEILLALRDGTSPFVGRELRRLLFEAGFEPASAAVKGVGGGDPRTNPFYAEFQAGMFDAPAVVAYVVHRAISSAEEMAAVAAAWREWGSDPAALSAGHWFEVTARAPA